MHGSSIMIDCMQLHSNVSSSYKCTYKYSDPLPYTEPDVNDMVKIVG